MHESVLICSTTFLYVVCLLDLSVSRRSAMGVPFIILSFGAVWLLCL